MPPLKKPGHYQSQGRKLKREKKQTECTKNSIGNNNSDATNPNPNKIYLKNNDRNDEKPKTVQPPSETCGKTKNSTEKDFLQPIQQTARLLE